MLQWFSKKRIIVEKALPDDVHTLAEIHKDGFRQCWSDGDFISFLGNEKYFCLVAREENWVTRKLLGFVLVRQIEDEAEIVTIATLSKVRRSGVGRKLMDEAIRWLQYDRVSRLFLEVDENNQPAVNMYNGLRFKQISVRKGYYQGHALGAGKPSNALVMQRDLS